MANLWMLVIAVLATVCLADEDTVQCNRPFRNILPQLKMEAFSESEGAESSSPACHVRERAGWKPKKPRGQNAQSPKITIDLTNKNDGVAEAPRVKEMKVTVEGATVLVEFQRPSESTWTDVATVNARLHAGRVNFGNNPQQIKLVRVTLSGTGPCRAGRRCTGRRYKLRMEVKVCSAGEK